MSELLDLKLDTFTIVSCIVIFVAFVWAWIYIARTNSVDVFKRRKWINQLPSIISTLGVLGTFIGITKGLVNFKTDMLDESIPLLLDGLKTAFFTSLTGMAGSLVLNRVVSAKFDRESMLSDSEKAAKMLIKAVDESLPKILEENNKKFVGFLSNSDEISSINGDIEQLKDDVEEIKGILQEINSYSKGMSEEVSSLKAVVATATESISVIDNNVCDISQNLSSVNTMLDFMQDTNE